MINLGDYLSLINDWEVNNPLPPSPVINYSKVVKPIKLVEQPAIKSKVIPSKINSSLLAKELVDGIKAEAFSIGWTPSQLVELEKLLPCFIPCQLAVILQSISINQLHADGSVRGAVTFYNNEIDQPWLKHNK